MKTSRTRLQYLVLLAIPMMLVAVYGITQETPKPQRTPKYSAVPRTTSNAEQSQDDKSAKGSRNPTLPTDSGGDYDSSGVSGAESYGAGSGFGPAGGFGSPASFGSAAGFADDQRLIQGQNIMISWSKENDELRGFSQKSGEWANLKIVKQESLVPVVGTDVAAVRVGDAMAAYSGTTGTWDVLKLSAGSKALAVVSTNVVQTTDNDYLYTFAAAKGRWTSPNDPRFRPANVSGDQYGFTSGYGHDPNTTGLSSIPGSTHPGVEILSTASNARRFDQTDLNLARQFRGKGLDDPEARAQLSQAVANAFDQRQAHQKIEAKRLQEKLKVIQDAIQRREALRERIIQRRVDELLDPNVDWDSLSSSPAGTPIGLSGPPHLPEVGPTGTMGPTGIPAKSGR